MLDAEQLGGTLGGARGPRTDAGEYAGLERSRWSGQEQKQVYLAGRCRVVLSSKRQSSTVKGKILSVLWQHTQYDYDYDMHQGNKASASAWRVVRGRPRVDGGCHVSTLC
jgi:hypothetical protein